MGSAELLDDALLVSETIFGDTSSELNSPVKCAGCTSYHANVENILPVRAPTACYTDGSVLVANTRNEEQTMEGPPVPTRNTSSSSSRMEFPMKTLRKETLYMVSI